MLEQIEEGPFFDHLFELYSIEDLIEIDEIRKQQEAEYVEGYWEDSYEDVKAGRR